MFHFSCSCHCEVYEQVVRCAPFLYTNIISIYKNFEVEICETLIISRIKDMILFAENL